VRHPLADLRLIRFAAALPAVPWCVDKHLLRCCLRTLPSAIRSRPKSPLAGNPVIQLVRRGALARVAVTRRAPELSTLVHEERLTATLSRAVALAEAELWPLLRTVALDAWAAAELAV
jgi:hypothetical protein